MANILVVDDERNVRSLIKRILEERNHTVTAVATAEEALVEMRRQPFDLMTLDLRLPGISGIELLRRMQQEGREMPILIVSAITNAIPVVEAMKSGASDYLSKPFPAQDLVKKVEELLNQEEITFEKLERKIEEKLNQERYDIAERMARQLFAINPSADAHFIYGMVMEKLGNPVLALKHLKAALIFDPDHKRALKEIQRYEKES
ncbi:MAG: response regulator [Pseudothermotoga sp.]